MRLSSHRGFSLVELMISITIGMLLLAGLTGLFVNNTRARDEIERINQQTDNGRYAMQIITDDLKNAGYLAQFDPTPLTAPAAKPDPCATDLPGLRAALPLGVQGYDNPATPPSCLADVRPNTDVLVVRHAATCAAGSPNCDAPPGGAPLFQASACSSAAELSSPDPLNHYKLDTTPANLTLKKNDCVAAAPYQQYMVRIYFIANNDKAGDGIPTLKRAELTDAGFSVVPLVEGIQDMQIEYGIDTATPTTGSPATFQADPDTLDSCAPAVCVTYWRNVVAARVNLLARNTRASLGYTDDKTYTLGLAANGGAYTVGPANDAYRRHAYAATVRLHNIAGRITP